MIFLFIDLKLNNAKMAYIYSLLVPFFFFLVIFTEASIREGKTLFIFAILMIIFEKCEPVDSVICEYSSGKTRTFASVFKSPAVRTLTL